MYLRSLFLYLFNVPFLCATETLISLNNLSQVDINGGIYRAEWYTDPAYEPYTHITLDSVSQNGQNYHNKISFWWCYKDQNSISLMPVISGDTKEELELSFSKSDIDPNTELNVVFDPEKPFRKIITSLNQLALCQTVTAKTNLDLDDGETLEIKFIFSRIRRLEFLSTPIIHVDHRQHITTIQPRAYLSGENPETAVNLRFSKGRSVFSHDAISTEQVDGQWSCDALGRLHPQQRITYKTDTPELMKWVETSGISFDFGDYSVVIDQPETAGQLLTDPLEFAGKTIKKQANQQEVQINDKDHYIYAGAGGTLYLARTVSGISGSLNVLRPTLVQVSNRNQDVTSYQGTFYEGSFYKHIKSTEASGFTTSSFVQVGDPTGQVVTVTSAEEPLSELDLTSSLLNLNSPGQPIMDELTQLFQNILKRHAPYTHMITVDNNGLPLDKQQLISELFYLMMDNLKGELEFWDMGQCKLKILESSTIAPNKWDAIHSRILNSLKLHDYPQRQIIVEEIHADVSDYKFFLSLQSLKRVFVDKVHVYFNSEIQGDMFCKMIVDLLSSSKLRYNQIIIHADDNQSFMTSPHLRKLVLLLANLKKGIRPGLPAEQNDQRMPSLRCKEFIWDADTALIPDNVQDKDTYLANRIPIVDPAHLTTISYNNMRESYPKAHTAFVDMLAKLSQEDSPKLNLLDLNGSKFKDATQTSQVIAAISKFTVLEKFSWISKGAYQVDNQGLFTCDDFLCSTNQGVVTELLQLVQALSKIPTLRQLGLNMCYLSSIFDGYEIHHHHNESTSKNNQWIPWLIYGDAVTKPRPTTDHRELIVALLKSMPATMLELHSNIKMDTETIEWLISILRDVCPDCCPGYPNVNNKRSVTISDSKHTVSTMLPINR